MIRLSLTHADLADMIGTTRETVTNQMNRFKRMGLVGAVGRHLVVDRRCLMEFMRHEESRPDDESHSLDRSA